MTVENESMFYQSIREFDKWRHRVIGKPRPERDLALSLKLLGLEKQPSHPDSLPSSPLHQKEALLTDSHHMIHYPTCPHEQLFNMNPRPWSICAGWLYVSWHNPGSPGKREPQLSDCLHLMGSGHVLRHFLKLIIAVGSPSQPWAGGLELCKKASWESHGERGSKTCSSVVSASVPTGKFPPWHSQWCPRICKPKKSLISPKLLWVSILSQQQRNNLGHHFIKTLSSKFYSVF
jgi:hypothetical protein